MAWCLKHQAITWFNVDPVLQSQLASPGHNELKSLISPLITLLSWRPVNYAYCRHLHFTHRNLMSNLSWLTWCFLNRYPKFDLQCTTIICILVLWFLQCFTNIKSLPFLELSTIKRNFIRHCGLSSVIYVSCGYNNPNKGLWFWFF